MRDIRQDEMELSIEDLDVLLESWAQMQQLVLSEEVPRESAITAVHTPLRAPACEIGTLGAPEFRDSGLLVESHADEVRITVPPLDDSRVTAAVLADLTELWELSPRRTPWTVEVGRLERAPVSLFSQLVELNCSATPPQRIIRLRGLEQIQSRHLSECLRRSFEFCD